MSNTRKNVEYISADHCYVFQCPHCACYTQVADNEVNCQIFRHGILKSTGMQVNPHASKEYCDRLVTQHLVDGCCGPFKLFRGSNGVVEYVDICDYI